MTSTSTRRATPQPVAIAPRSTEQRVARLAALLSAGLLAACSASLGPQSIVSGPVGDATPPSAHAGPASEQTSKAPTSAAPPGSATAEASRAHQPPSLAELARANGTDPANPQTTLAYARGLKRSGKRAEALAVLDKGLEAQPNDQPLLVEQGLLALELGQTQKAAKSLKIAASAPDKDWRVLSGLGVAASSLGRQKEAQGHFARALALSPDNPTVLNNMAMSLILDRKIDQAEAMLQRAAKSGAPRHQVAQNLALAKALKEDALDGGGAQ